MFYALSYVLQTKFQADSITEACFRSKSQRKNRYAIFFLVSNSSNLLFPIFLKTNHAFTFLLVIGLSTAMVICQNLFSLGISTEIHILIANHIAAIAGPRTCSGT